MGLRETTVMTSSILYLYMKDLEQYYLNMEDQQSLSEEFEKVDENIGRDVYQRLAHLADHLE